MEPTTNRRARPLSPNIQIYRPQLTSVLSIANRITGIILTVCAIVLVAWLAAAASGQQTYDRFQHLLESWPSLFLLLAATFAFFLHLFGGIRHLIWDSVRAFELRQIYGSGWIVVGLSVTLTLVSWLVSLTMAGQG